MAWLETYRPLRRLEPLFCIAESKRCQCFMPLVLWHKNWKNLFQKVIIPVGYSDFDYHDPIISCKTDDKHLNDFWSKLFLEINNKFKYDLIILDGIHKNLSSPFKQKKQEKCPYIPLTGFESLDDFRVTLSKKVNKNIDRRIHRLKELGQLVFKKFNHETTLQAVNELELMLKYHSLRWPNSYKAPNFHKYLIKFGLERDIVHFSTLSIGSITLSWRICFVDKEKFYSYMPTINPDFHKYSPGKIHLLYCIEDAIKSDKQFYDQMRGEEFYKSEWTSFYNQISTYVCSNHILLSQGKNYIVKFKEKIF